MAVPTVNGIEYIHLIEDYQKGIDDRGPWYKCRFYITNYSDSDNFGNALLGIGVTTLPNRYVLSQNVFAQAVTIEGLGNPVLNADGLPTSYDGGALVDVIYRSSAFQGTLYADSDPNNYEQIFDPNVSPVLYCTQEVDFGVEMHTIPNHNYKWESDNTSAGIPVKIEISLTTLSMTFHRIRLIPTGQIRSCRGKINGPGPQITSTNLILPASDGTFLGAARGHVLFQGARSVREVASNGEVSRKLNMVFVERSQPWGKFLRNDSANTWDYLKDSSNNHLYEEVDMRPLLYFAQLT